MMMEMRRILTIQEKVTEILEKHREDGIHNTNSSPLMRRETLLPLLTGRKAEHMGRDAGIGDAGK